MSTGGSNDDHRAAGPGHASNTVNTLEDTEVSGNVLINDTDVDGGVLTVASHTDPAHGTLTLNDDGTFTYTPAADYNGADAFTYTATDGLGRSNPATVAITIAPVNDAPVAVDDAFTTIEGIPVSGSVLANDTDIDGNPLTMADFSQPSHGSVSMGTDGTFTYTPAAGYLGADSFTYTATDGTDVTNLATVAITVKQINHAPVFTATVGTADPVTGEVPVTVQIIDPEGDPVTATVVSWLTKGTLTGDMATGNYTYTPDLAARIAAAQGGATSDSFTIAVSDADNPPVNYTVDIPVTPGAFTVAAPVSAGGASTMVVNADGTRAYVANDSGVVVVLDADGNVVGTPITVGASPSALALSGNRLYIANSGSDNVTIVDTTDNSVLGTVTVGDDPRGIAVSEYADLTYVTNYGSNSVSVIGFNTGTNSYQVVKTIALPANSRPWGIAADASGHHLFVASSGTGKVSIINAMPESADFNKLVHETTVGGGPIGVAAGPSSNYDKVFVVNSADSTVTVMDTGPSFAVIATIPVATPGSGPYQVVVSDDGSIAYVSVPGAGPTYDGTVAAIDAHNLVRLDADNTVPGIQNIDVGTAPLGMGFDPVTNTAYVINRGENTISAITVGAVNTAPVAVSDSYATAEDTPLTIAAPGVLGNDIDPDGNPLLFATSTQPAHGTLTLSGNGAFTYMPNPNFNGFDTFTYSLSDGAATGNTATVTIQVIPVNDGPVANPDVVTTPEDTLVSGNVLANDTDADNDALFATLATGPTHGTVNLNPDGSFSYTPAADYNGADSFGYYANDTQGGANLGAVTVTITPVNDAPIPGAPAYTIDNMYPTTGIVDGAIHVADPEGEALTYAAPETTGKGGSVTITSSGGFTYTPTEAARHAASADDAAVTGANKDGFTVTVTDAQGAATNVWVTVFISPTNAAPVGSGPTVGSPNAAGAVAGSLNVTDADPDTLIYHVSTAPTYAQVTVDAATGAYTYTPYASARLKANTTPAQETDTFTVAVTDGHGGSANVTVAAVPVSAADAIVTSAANVGTAPLGVAVNRDGTRAYVANEGSNTVSVVDNATGAVVATVPVGSHPVGVAVTPNGKYAYVTNQAGNSVSVIDTALNSVATTITVGGAPQQVAIRPDGNFAYVTNRGGNSVSVINTASNAVVATVPVSGQPYGVAVSPDGARAYVTLTNANSVAVIDTAANAVIDNIAVGSVPYGVAFSPDGSRAYVANLNGHSVSVINTSTKAVVATVGVAGRPAMVAASPDGSVVYATPLDSSNVVSLIDTATNTVVDTVPVPGGNAVPGVAVSPDGVHAYVTSPNAARLSTITLDAVPEASATVSAPDPATGKITVTLAARDAAGEPLTITNTAVTQGRLTIVDNANGTWTYTYRPTDIARLYAGMTQGTVTDPFTITVTDPYGLKATVPVNAVTVSPATATVTATAAVGNSPFGVAVSPDGNRTYVTNQSGNSVSVIDTKPGSATYNTVIATIPVASFPRGVTVSPDGTRAYVTSTGGSSVSVIDTNPASGTYNTVIANIPVGSSPRGVAVTRDGTRLYVTNEFGNSVSVIDTKPGSATYNTVIATIPVGNIASAVAVSPDGTRIYVSNRGDSTVSVIDTNPASGTYNAVVATVPVSGGPYAVAESPDGTRLYVADRSTDSMAVIDTNPASGTYNTVIANIPVGHLPTGVAVSPDGTLAYVVNQSSGSVTVIDTAHNSVIDLDPATAGIQGIAVGSSPWTVAVSPDGTHLYVTNAGSNTVSVITLGQTTPIV